jgi:hypothetical protein
LGLKFPQVDAAQMAKLEAAKVKLEQETQDADADS